MIEKKGFLVPSSDGIHTLSGVVYLPDSEPRGLFHAVHGMTDHIARYDRILTDLAAAGYIAYGYDHLGHGTTARDPSELGYFAKERGGELLARDVAAFSEAVRAEYGTPALPLCLMGHSMGSFVVRLAAERFITPDRLIVMGTAGPNPAAIPGLALVGVLRCLFGAKHISPLLEKIAFGGYNRRFGGDSPDDPKRWLSTDEAVRRAYYADPFCMFKFTVSAMGDLIRLIRRTNTAAWYRDLPAGFPILLVSGEDDPVADYGRGVREVARRLAEEGKTVTCKLYPGARHEILNDFTYEEVRDDILAFLRAD